MAYWVVGLGAECTDRQASALRDKLFEDAAELGLEGYSVSSSVVETVYEVSGVDVTTREATTHQVTAQSEAAAKVSPDLPVDFVPTGAVEA
jgi:hypothetical protein